MQTVATLGPAHASGYDFVLTLTMQSRTHARTNGTSRMISASAKNSATKMSAACQRFRGEGLDG